MKRESESAKITKTQNRFLWIRITSPGQGEEGEDGEDADADVAAARWEAQWIPSALLRGHGLIPDTVQNAKAFSGNCGSHGIDVGIVDSKCTGLAR